MCRWRRARSRLRTRSSLRCYCPLRPATSRGTDTRCTRRRPRARTSPPHTRRRRWRLPPRSSPPRKRRRRLRSLTRRSSPPRTRCSCSRPPPRSAPPRTGGTCSRARRRGRPKMRRLDKVHRRLHPAPRRSVPGGRACRRWRPRPRRTRPVDTRGRLRHRCAWSRCRPHKRCSWWPRLQNTCPHCTRCIRWLRKLRSTFRFHSWRMGSTRLCHHSKDHTCPPHRPYMSEML